MAALVDLITQSCVAHDKALWHLGSGLLEGGQRLNLNKLMLLIRLKLVSLNCVCGFVGLLAWFLQK
jgi:hypothetical protein